MEPQDYVLLFWIFTVLEGELLYPWWRRENMQSWPCFFWWTYSLMHSGRSHIYTVVYFAHYRSRREQAVTFRAARYTESALLACLHSIQSSESPMNRQTCSCACSTRACVRAARAHFTCQAKNPHRKGHFATSCAYVHSPYVPCKWRVPWQKYLHKRQTQTNRKGCTNNTGVKSHI